MITPRLPENEHMRLNDVYNSQLLDTPEEKEFNEIVQLASALCNMPISLITLLDNDRQWFKARVGLDVVETSREISFCGHAILQDELFEIPDALEDMRFFDNPLVLDGPEIRYYAGVPLVTESGSRLGTLCVIDRLPRSLTDSQRFALKVLAANVIKIAELRIKNKQLHELTEMQKLMIAVISHDVRNPLAALQTILELQDDGTLDIEEAAGMLQMVKPQVQTTVNMLNSLVEWGTIQMSKNLFVTTQIDFKQLVEDVFKNERLAAKSKNNELINKVALGYVLKIDPQIIKFILRNLISNAIKFTANGTITVSVNAKLIGMEIFVSDTGVGMTQETIDRLSDSTSYIALTTQGTKNEKGNGLGFMLIKEFVRQLKGSIKVESALNKGTIVSINL
jgi:signal transduction histidine kinase